jgi:hypothetical protein
MKNFTLALLIISFISCGMNKQYVSSPDYRNPNMPFAKPVVIPDHGNHHQTIDANGKPVNDDNAALPNTSYSDTTFKHMFERMKKFYGDNPGTLTDDLENLIKH